MTKEKFIICAAVAFFGAVLGFFVKISKRSVLKEILDLTIGIFLLLVIFSFFTTEPIEIDFDESTDYSDYEKISDDVMREVISETSEKIEETVTLDICARFKIENVKSEVKINPESFEIEKAIVYIKDSEKHISNYQIKTYIKQKYDMDVEVLIC